MKVTATALPDVRLIEPRVFGDERGFFFESWNARAFAAAGLPATFVQDNHSRSARGVLRGLHYQIEHAQGKLVRVTAGEVFDVVVDLRRSSATFGRSFGLALSAANRRMLWVPPGFAHGFVVRSDDGGAGFAEIANGLEFELSAISFVNPDEGWAAASKYTEGGAAIGVTTDGGETWEFVQPPDLPDDEIVGSAMGASGVLAGCNGVRFFGRLVGVAHCTTATFESDGSTGLFLTDDGGATWVTLAGYKAAFSMQLAAASTILDMAAPDCTRAWLVGEGKVIARWENDDETMDCEAGGAPSDDAPADNAVSGAADDGCGCAAAGATATSGVSLLSLLF